MLRDVTAVRANTDVGSAARAAAATRTANQTPATTATASTATTARLRGCQRAERNPAGIAPPDGRTARCRPGRVSPDPVCRPVAPPSSAGAASGRAGPRRAPGGGAGTHPAG
jgi:hypothetical protein